MKLRPNKHKLLIISTLLTIGLGVFVVLNNRPHSVADTLPVERPVSSKTTAKLDIAPKEDKGLSDLLTNWAANHNKTYGIYVEEINPAGRFAGYNQTKSMVPASTYKLFLAYVIYNAVEQNKLSLETKTRTGYTIQGCIERMLVYSDNECAKALGFMYGWDNVNADLRKQGFNQTNLNNYESGSETPVREKATTALEEANLLNQLQSKKLLSLKHTDELFSFLRKQVHRQRLAAGLPKGVDIVSKPGWLDYVQTDAGIVYGSKSTYIIVVLSDETTPTPLATLSKQIYDYLNN